MYRILNEFIFILKMYMKARLFSIINIQFINMPIGLYFSVGRRIALIISDVEVLLNCLIALLFNDTDEIVKFVVDVGRTGTRNVL